MTEKQMKLQLYESLKSYILGGNASHDIGFMITNIFESIILVHIITDTVNVETIPLDRNSLPDYIISLLNNYKSTLF